MVSTRSIRSPRGISIFEVLAVVFGLVVLIAIAIPMIARRDCGTGGLRAATMLKQLHQASIVLAGSESSGATMPIDATDGPLHWLHAPGRGTRTTTAEMYSAMVMMEYYTTDMLISPIEENPRVTEYRKYDYDLYDPVQGVHWDPGFKADLADVSHASWAHTFANVARCERVVAFDANFPVFAVRGPKDGILDPASYTVTERRGWEGYVCWADNSTELSGRTYGARLRDGDDLFRVDDGPDGDDAILTFVIGHDADGPIRQHD